ncbi:sigma-l-dependent transcriptional regulator [hydrocarbon metagenome]|uniref:Sigma-l-dependent transcriptional regulator n=1 Tax=hydrocarbon metagenome TaxID=938273 RepID=A0A0W8E6E0_9ZZZZ
MIVGNFMNKDVIVLDLNTTLYEAAEIFLNNEIDGAPVVDGKIMIGLFTKTHLIRAMHAKDELDKPVKDYMTRKVRTVNPEEEILDVDVSGTGRYPVVDESGQLVGIITKSDIMTALSEIVSEISGQMETVINSAYNPIVAIDKEGYINIWNRAMEKMSNQKASDVLGRFISNIVPESNLLSVIKSGRREFGIKLKVGDKSTITNRAPIITNGEITGAVAVLHDLSEVEAISRELEYVKALNAEMDALIDSSYDGLYITDENAVTIRTNKAIKRVTGMEEEVFLFKSMQQLVDDGILSRSATLISMDTKAPATTTLTTITGRTLLVSATPIFDVKGEIYRVITNVRDISELNMLKQKLEQMEGLKQHFEFQVKQIKVKESGQLVVKNKEMEKIIYQAVKVAEVDSTVLLSGESGVGKEVIAEIIKNNSARKDGPFVKVNCAAIPENLIESELFGYDAGAFTGARKEGKPGLFEVANTGTLLLDEVGDIPIYLQVKLLRALQEREIIRVGGTEPIKINVRIIAITNKDLAAMVESGEFREDLYYRLNVVPILVPPLRDRREEIPLLIKHFTDNFNRRYNLSKSVDASLIDILMKYEWPGNIRQLENLIERLVVTSSCEVLTPQHLPDFFVSAGGGRSADQAVSVNKIIPLKDAVENVEKQLLEKTFAIANSCGKAASILEVDASTISRKASKYGIKH